MKKKSQKKARAKARRQRESKPWPGSVMDNVSTGRGMEAFEMMVKKRK